MIELVEGEISRPNKECVPQTSERVQMGTIKSNQVEITNLEERKGRGMKA